jgi:O-antigen/teichoic acid export membrane protein
MIHLVYASFQSYWSAQVFPVAQRDDADVVIPRIFTYVLLLVSFCALGLTFACRPIIRLLTTPQFHSAAFLAPVIICAYYIHSISSFFRCFFLVEGHPEYEAFCNWIGAAVCLVSYFVLIPRYGIWRAGIATALTFGIMGLIAIGWTYRLRPYHFESGRILKILLVGGGLVAFHLAVPVESVILEIVRGALLLLAFPAILYGLSFHSPAEIVQVRQLWAGALRRVGLGSAA